jgi:hypothetical protein
MCVIIPDGPRLDRKESSKMIAQAKYKSQKTDAQKEI